MLSSSCVILAAGLGTRMRSSQPKVIHKLYDQPMLQYVIDSAGRLNPKKMVIVVGKNHDLVRDSVSTPPYASFAVQKKPMGTAHALLCGAAGLKGFTTGTIFVLNGDMPLVRPETLKRFLSLHKRNGNALSVASFISDDPGGYGRIVRDRAGKALRIVEARDASPEEKSIKEVNSGLYALESSLLGLLSKVKLNRAKGEYYLTDLFGMALADGRKAAAYCMAGEDEFLGINTRQELLKAHEVLKNRQISICLQKGVSFIDADSVFIHPGVSVGKGTLIYPNVHLQGGGKTRIGRGCVIYPNVRVVDSIIKDGAVIKDATLIEGSTVGLKAEVGPFAHIRPGSSIGASAKIGNFVEVKKSAIGKGAKAMHLSYLGDAKVGRDVNIGAGTITCNYDGMRKHKTVIEDRVFVGSGSQLIAPVRVKKGSYIGAGSTITEDVPAGSLAVSRVKQKNIKGWAKKRFKAKKAHRIGSKGKGGQ